MKITNEFTVHTPIDEAWKLLTDLEAIAPCMPGAVLTGVEDDVYKGKVKVKVGPVISEFAGTARFLSKSDEDYTASIDAKGRDARTSGNAAAVVTAVLRPDGDSTTVSVDTDLKITGKLAQFGSGMIKEVSTKLLAQFVTNLEAKLAADPATPEPAESEVVGSAASEVTAPSHAEAEPSTAPSHAEAEPSTAPSHAEAEPATAPSLAAVETVPDIAVSPSAAEPPAVSPTVAAGAPVNGVASASAVQAPTVTARPSGTRTFAPAAEEPEPLDLLSVAGSSVYKRLIPVALGVVVVGAVIAWLVRRH